MFYTQKTVNCVQNILVAHSQWRIQRNAYKAVRTQWIDFWPSPPHPYVGRSLGLPFIKSWINSLEQAPDVCLWYFKEMKMLGDKTKLQKIFINQSLEKSLLITTHGCVAKEYMLSVPKIPVRSYCCSSFRLYLYVQITNIIVQKQEIALTQYT